MGRFVGVNALAAVGATGSVNYLILGFVIGMCNGFAIPIEQLFGADVYKRQVIAQSVERILGKDEVGSSKLPNSSKSSGFLRLRNFFVIFKTT